MQVAIRFQSALFVIAILLFCGFARTTETLGQELPCSVEDKKQYYKDFEASYEGPDRNRVKALEVARKYLACPADASDEEEILAKINLAVGRMLSLKGSDAIPYFVKAASYNSTVQSSPKTYLDLALAYEEGPYEKLSAAYTEKFSGKEETEESKRELEYVDQVIDRMIDAYARVVALTGVPLKPSSPHSGRNMAEVALDPLIQFYKYRHNGSDAGLKNVIAGVLSQPLPEWPITTKATKEPR
jgi:hypothetical protein